jgi:hypothetical protein
LRGQNAHNTLICLAFSSARRRPAGGNKKERVRRAAHSQNPITGR